MLRTKNVREVSKAIAAIAAIDEWVWEIEESKRHSFAW